jgi:hypothetical protein
LSPQRLEADGLSIQGRSLPVMATQRDGQIRCK